MNQFQRLRLAVIIGLSQLALVGCFQTNSAKLPSPPKQAPAPDVESIVPVEVNPPTPPVETADTRKVTVAISGMV